ncbi:MAG: hypothetical protein ACREAX_01435, partial [Candidatus Nitrosotenuis sp.]
MSSRSIMVKFRFDGDAKSQIGEFTYEQYDNLKALPSVTECKIVLNEQPTLTENDIVLINEKIAQA